MVPSYSPEERRRALELYVEVGPCQGSRETGIPKQTITRWAKAAGLEPPTANILASVQAHNARIAARRAELKQLLLDKAVDLAHRMDEPHIDFKGVNVEQVTFPKAPAAACQNYATSIGILIDKFRLENGEVTGREEMVTVDAVDREIQRLEAELARRGAADQRDPEPTSVAEGEAG